MRVSMRAVATKAMALIGLLSISGGAVAQTAQTIQFTSLPNLVYQGTGTVTATGGGSGNPVTFTSQTTSTCTISGSTLTGVAAGTCTIAADQAGNANYLAAPTQTASLTVAKATQTITFGAAPILSVGGTGTVSATGGASGNPVTFTSKKTNQCTISGATVTGVATGNCVIAANQAASANYSAAPEVTQTIPVKTNQTITFSAPAPQTYSPSGTFALSASATSGLAVTFSSSTPGVCSVSGATATILGAGSCTIAADQAGNAYYNPAPTVTQTVAIAQAAQTITFGAAPTLLVGGTATVSATGGGSGNPVTFTSKKPNQCTISGTTVTGVALGNCVIAANQAASANYTAAPEVTQTFPVGKNQTITFSAPAPQTYSPSGTFALSASATSGLVVTFSSSTPGVCSVSGTTATILGAGSCTIAADQAGNTYYNPAPTVTQTVAIAQAAQTITFGAAPSVSVGIFATVSATGGGSGQPVILSSLTPSTCSVTGAQVQGIGVGTCTVAANQAGTANYTAALQVTQTISVAQGTQTITFGVAPTVTVGNSGTLSATGGGSGNPIVFTTLTPSICSANGNTVFGIAAGTCTIAANQAGNANYSAAPQVTLTIPVKQNQTVAFSAPAPQTYSPSGTFALSASATSGLAVTFSSSTPGVCSVSGATVTILGAGSCTIAADQAGDTTYNPAPTVTRTVAIAQAAQTITFGAAPSLSVGNSATLNAAGGGSGQPVVFQSSTALTCTVIAGTNIVQGVAVGSCTITATQAATTNYSAAPQVTQTFTVAQGTQTITFNGAPTVTVGSSATLSATGGGSGNPVVFASTTPSVCTVSGTNGSTVNGVAAGSCTITANQAGSANYQAAAQATQNLSVISLSLPTPSSATPTVAAVPATDPISDAVGATLAQFRIDEGGNATYSLPIQIPPGTAGMSPKLALSYNSRLPSGVMGPGWTIEGASQISRCRQTRESGDFAASGTPDGNASPVNFTVSDRFCLDGVRLLVTSGSYGASGSVYSPENDPTTQVTPSVTNAAIGPDSFTVKRKDGSTSTYGNTAASTNALVTATPSGGSTAVNVSWNLSRVQDSTGNYIDYLYTSRPAQSESALSSLPFASAAVETVLAQVNYTGHFTGNVADVAPYASITFNYAALPLTNLRIGYQAGVTFLQSQQLSNVTVSDAGVLRYYALTYQTSTSGSQFQQLSQVQECRDSSMSVCFAPTTFSWSQTNNTFQPQANAQNGPDFTKMVALKIADIDGDGRQDIVWATDSDGCNSNSKLHVGFLAGASNGQMTLDVHDDICAPIDLAGNDRAWYLIDYDGDGRADLLIGDTLGRNWHLYLSKGNQSGAVFDTVDQFTSGAHPLTTQIAIPSNITSITAAVGIVADVNGDGLPDFIYPADPNVAPYSDIIARVMVRQSGGGFAFSEPQIVSMDPAPTSPCAQAAYDCVYNLFYNDAQHRSPITSDVNGDGRADMTLLYAVRNSSPPCSGCTPAKNKMHFDPTLGQPKKNGKSLTATTTTVTGQYWGQFAANGATSNGTTTLSFQEYWSQQVTGTDLPTTTDKFFVVDLNGDGLADILYQSTTDTTGQTYVALINNGTGYNATSVTVTGITHGDHLQLLDINGDGKTDLVYYDDSHNYHFVALIPTTSGSGWAFSASATVPSGGFPQDSGSIQWTGILGDFDGDGMPDLFSYETHQSGVASYFTQRVQGGSSCTAASNSASCSRYHPRDVVTDFTNGYGAKTTVIYQPLTNAGIYQRGGGTGYPALSTATDYGWGSPVFDVLAPMYVISQATSSAPTQSSAQATSKVLYRYGGATMQAGGRGFLGFYEVWAFDGNDAPATGQYVGTVTRYAQRYPLTGMPIATLKQLFPGYSVVRGGSTLEACAGNIESSSTCFSGITGSGAAMQFQSPWPDWVGKSSSPGIYVSNSLQMPACAGPGCQVLVASNACTLSTGAGFAMAQPVDYTSSIFAGPTSAGPVFVYAQWTNDVQYDPDDSQNNATNTNQGTRPSTASVLTNYCYDGNGSTAGVGNLVGSKTTTSDGAGSTVAQKVSQNTYTDDTTKWYLGRLTQSTVTFARPGQTTNITRTTNFTYDTSKGLLISEEIQKGGAADQDLRTLYDLDAFGNRTAAYQCSQDLTDAHCRQHDTVTQQQSGTTVLRYAKTSYDSIGRYVIGSSVPFSTASGGWNEKQAMSVDVRDEFGNPVQQHSINDTNGSTLKDITGVTQTSYATTQFARFGAMGRPYFGADSSGHSSTTTYRNCSGTNAVSCSTDTRFKFRSQTVATGAPSSWTYYDVLGRPILKIAQSFDNNAAGKLFTGTCGFFDAHNRPVYQSEPFFLNVAATADGSPNLGSSSSPCASSPNATTNPLGASIYRTLTQYDTLGRVVNVTAPDNTFVTKGYSALTTSTMNQRSMTFTTTTNALGEVIQSNDPGAIKDSLGNITGGGDATTNLIVTMSYRADGSATAITRDAGNGAITTNFTYDDLGRKGSQSDNDSGATTFTYNAAGDVITQKDANAQTITLSYDAMGRKWKRTTSGAVDSNNITDTWTYDTATNGYGQLASEGHTATTATSFSRAFTYDALGRLYQRTTSVAGSSYTETTAFDASGRARQQQDATGQITTVHYTTRGFVDAQTDTRTDGATTTTNNDVGNTQHLLYELLGTNERGQPMQERRGGTANLVTTLSYYANTGRLNQVCTGASTSITGSICSGGTLQDLQYAWDAAGNLSTRTRNYSSSKNPAELFTYDALNRLTQSQLGTLSGTSSLTNILATQTQTYDSLGNLCSQATTGSVTNTSQTYTYAGPAGCANHGASGSAHAVTQISGSTSASFTYDADGNQTNRSSDGRKLTYNVLNQIAKAELGAHTTKFEYGPDGERYLRNDDGVYTYYIGKVEIQKNGGTVVEMRRYLGAAIDLVIANSTRYTFGDHLGSVDAIAKQDGSRYEAGSFDAWGNRRNPDNWQSVGTTAPLDTTTHGFTGHEHLDNFGFIHMNGRIYDPQLGKMLQADPVQNPGSQGLNRYAYVANNPLTLTDPSGYSWLSWLKIAAAVAITVWTGGLAAGLLASGSFWGGLAVAAAGGFAAGVITTGTLQGGLIGAFTAVAFYGIGSAFSIKNASGLYENGEITAIGETGKVLAHGVVGGVGSVLSGGKFGNGFVSAGVAEAASGKIAGTDAKNLGFSAQRVIAAAIVGGTTSALTGGKFENGAITAAMAQAFNDESHKSIHPQPGTTITANGDDINITMRNYYFGDGATSENIALAGAAIEKYWKGQFGNYNVTTTVEAVSGNAEYSDDVNFVELSKGDFRSYVTPSVDGSGYAYGRLGISRWSMGGAQWQANETVWAHEAGHLMGLPDMYLDLDCCRGSIPWGGHEHDIMGSTGRGSKVTQFDIDMIFTH